MDVQRYISSGIIESYVVGLATDQEVRELQAAMAQSPDIKAAVDAAQLDMEKYVQLFSIAPPEPVKDRIFQRLTGEGADTIVPVSGGSEETYSYAAAEEEPVKEKRLVSAAWQYVAAAAIIGLIASVYFNFNYYNSVAEWKNKYQALLFDQEKMVADKGVYQTKVQQAEEMLDRLRQADMKMVRMYTASKSRPNLLATVYINPKSADAYLTISNLPEPPADQQYQLWGIVNNVPVDAGVFEMGEAAKGFQKVKFVPGAQLYAVTLEKKGGSPTPTLTAMYVAGKVGT
ncbi:anti-sigma factor [Chitinophaga lutea]|uniref:Anti-sigma factor n=1 Tax=Chitinophaga lutea TaxID=2488634 RepID=A0A3N4PL84_9BACT|nr:anti-sigma factor [Chitinophaga lutea]RPE09443.1 anti-sigma factor [Chitinophaga lutea]